MRRKANSTPESDDVSTPCSLSAMRELNIEQVFATCVRRSGGRCLDEESRPPSGLKLADYYFEADNAVVELKRLAEDVRGEHVLALFRNWERRGLIPPLPKAGTFSVYTRDLPELCQAEHFRFMLNRLRNSTIKHANQQIRDTKVHLGVPSARGILMIASDGALGLRPGILRQLVQTALRDRFRNIHEAVVFTANYGVTDNTSKEATQFWAPLQLPGRELDRDGLSFRLAAPFYECYGEQAGITFKSRERPAPSFEEIERISFEGQPLPPT